ncbi:MAG: hypothetical protein OCD03_09380 [Hyphomicrobiales bacterium]
MKKKVNEIDALGVESMFESAEVIMLIEILEGVQNRAIGRVPLSCRTVYSYETHF